MTEYQDLTGHHLMARQLSEIVELMKRDPAIAGQVRAILFPDQRASGTKGPPPPFPALSEVTAIQTAIFDNWPTGKKAKGQPNRYGCAIEIWTKTADQIRVTGKPNWDFKSQLALMDAPNLRRQIKRLRNHVRKPSEEYLETLDGFAAAMTDDTRIGLLHWNIDTDASPYSRGSYYAEFGFVVAHLEQGKLVSVRLALRGEPLELAPFDPLDAAGNPHADRVILQSRHDLSQFSTTWATNDVTGS